MVTQVIPLEGIDKAGIIMDSPAVTLPPGAWTNARNVRFHSNAIRKMKGELDVFENLGLNAIQHIDYWENPNVRCYLIINREAGRDLAYLMNVNGDGTVNLSSARGDFTQSDSWSSFQYNGGYSLVVNNAIDEPRHITVQLGGSKNLNSQGTFAALPNWDSYASGTIAAGFISVSAEILIPFGNLMIAGALTERSTPQLDFIENIEVTGATAATVTFASTTSLAAGDQFQVVGDTTYEWTWTVTGDGTLIEPDETRTFTVTSPFNKTYTVVSKTGASVTCSVTDAFVGTQADSLTLPDQTTDTATPYSNMIPPYAAKVEVTSYHTRDVDGSSTIPVINRDLNGVVRASSVAPPGAIPTNWNPFASGPGTADELNLADTGKITAIAELRGNLFVYTSDTITQLRVSANGLTAVPITKEYGALTQSGVFGFQGTHLVVGSDDIYIFAGNPGDIKSIADGRMRDYFLSELDSTTFRNLQIVRNQIEEELWICYPLDQTGLLKEALIWNYTNNTFTLRDLPSVVSMTRGPIPGQGTSGSMYDFSKLTTFSGDIEFTRADGTRTSQPIGGSAFTATTLAADVQNAINGQTGFAAYQVDETVVFIDTRVGKNAWSIRLTIDGVDDPLEPTAFTGNLNDALERPWSQGQLNEARNYTVMATSEAMLAADVGYEGVTKDSFFERYNFQFAPSKDTEILSALFLQTEGTEQLKVIVTPIESAGEGRAITGGSEYMFALASDYKIDTRVTSRLVKLRFELTGEADWSIASIDLEVGKRGTR